MGSVYICIQMLYHDNQGILEHRIFLQQTLLCSELKCAQFFWNGFFCHETKGPETGWPMIAKCSRLKEH